MIKKLVLEIIRKALQAPIRQITANAGVDSSVVVGKLLEGKKGSHGYDAQGAEFCDMIAKGIIDPTKVVRTALQDAASISSLLITTEAMIGDKPEDKTRAVPVVECLQWEVECLAWAAWAEWECNISKFELKKPRKVGVFF